MTKSGRKQTGAQCPRESCTRSLLAFSRPDPLLSDSLQNQKELNDARDCRCLLPSEAYAGREGVLWGKKGEIGRGWTSSCVLAVDWPCLHRVLPLARLLFSSSSRASALFTRFSNLPFSTNIAFDLDLATEKRGNNVRNQRALISRMRCNCFLQTRQPAHLLSRSAIATAYPAPVTKYVLRNSTVLVLSGISFPAANDLGLDANSPPPRLSLPAPSAPRVHVRAHDKQH